MPCRATLPDLPPCRVRSANCRGSATLLAPSNWRRPALRFRRRWPRALQRPRISFDSMHRSHPNFSTNPGIRNRLGATSRTANSEKRWRSFARTEAPVFTGEISPPRLRHMWRRRAVRFQLVSLPVIGHCARKRASRRSAAPPPIFPRGKLPRAILQAHCWPTCRVCGRRTRSSTWLAALEWRRHERSTSSMLPRCRRTWARRDLRQSMEQDKQSRVPSA